MNAIALNVFRPTPPQMNLFRCPKTTFNSRNSRLQEKTASSIHAIIFISMFEYLTRSSQQWWSGRSTTPHVVLDHLTLWRKLYDFSWSPLHNQPICYKMSFSSISNRLAASWKEAFRPTVWGLGWSTYIVYFLPSMSYSAHSESISTDPPVRPGYDDNYCSTGNSFVKRQKRANIANA